LEKINELDIRLEIIGDIKKIPKDAKKTIDNALELTSSNKGMTCAIALNYGGRQDIITAVNEAVKTKKKQTIKSFSKLLSTRNIGDVDLMIRTSGELRLSNFLL
jgi:undecaprenyl diphosphate synthase